MVQKLQIGRAAAVTPSDTLNIPNVAQENGKRNLGCLLYIGGSGDLVVTTEGKDTVTFVSVPAGSFLPVSVLRVHATGTSCTNILALW